MIATSANLSSSRRPCSRNGHRIRPPNNNAIVAVNILVAVNFKSIEARERLVLYRPAVAKPVERKREAPLVLAGGKKTKK